LLYIQFWEGAEKERKKEKGRVDSHHRSLSKRDSSMATDKTVDLNETHQT
jgi:hypothetical protein